MSKRPIYTDAHIAVRKIRKGKRIFIGSGCAEPQHMVNTLAENAEHFRDNEIVHLLTIGSAPYADEKYKKSFRHNAFFIGSNVRKAVCQGLADYTPIFLSEIPNLFNTKQMPIHAAIVQITPPDKNGYVSLGISVDIELSALLNAEIVIGQVNKNMPETLGKAKISLEHFDYLVEKDEPILELPKPYLDEVSLCIGRNIAKYIKDGDTLQMGIGKIPDAILKNLSDKNDLGIHTEMFSDGIIDLYKNGNITNKKKGFHDGVSITSFVMGSKELYDMLDKNPDFNFYPSEYVNDPFNIAKNNNMISINSALEVDLTGQVCADSLGSMFYSGIGGQVDFVRGAIRSKGGKSFIALPSTAKNGELSRIVPYLSEGAGVVTSRGDIHYVATEYGVAYLHGKTIRERGLALIQIAHPKFREELLDYMKQKHYVYLDQKTVKHDDTRMREIIPYSKKFKDKTIYFRALNSSDEHSIQDFFYNLNPETIYNRFYSYKESLPHEEAQLSANVNYNKDMAIAGFDSTEPYANMVCVARYVRNEDNTCTMALLTGEKYQKIGIGKFLIELLIQSAKEHKIDKMYAYVSYPNNSMLSLCEKFGFIKEENEDGMFLLSLKL